DNNCTATTINAGVLQIGDGGDSGNVTGTVTNYSILVFDRADDFTCSATLNGTGILKKNGAGTMTITNNNPLSGTTTINAGALQWGDGGAGGGVAGNVTDNAALIVNRADSFTYSGVLSGTGTLEKKGAGTMILTKNNSFSGLTTITAGTLQLGNGGFVGGLAGNITNNAALIFNRPDNFTHSGILDGSGTLEKKGSGALTLTGDNPFNGMTTITAGALQLGDGGAGGGLAGDIIDNALLIFNRADDFSFAGTITGAGGLVKRGGGALTLTAADNDYSGETRIEAGTLVLTETGRINPLSEITNDAAFVVDGGTHALGIISGTGDTQVASDAQIAVSSLVQGTLTIGGAPPSAGDMASQPVPEPAAWILLASLGAGWGIKRWFRRGSSSC
ncbi:MAG: autotransporter-associated beta strand repeat-containing protein, partial [Pirellulales bacterium]|nr:autotransporter-associated beta strand repeat-containing protein [Pirellulales bacterium]